MIASAVERIAQVAGPLQGPAKPLGHNSYCTIWKGQFRDSNVVFKLYKTPDAHLPKEEYEGVGLYHRLSSNVSELLPCAPVLFDEALKLCAFEFVDGDPPGDRLRHGHTDEFSNVCRAMTAVGDLMWRVRKATLQPAKQIADFHHEYLEYCTDQLRRVPGAEFWNATDDVAQLAEAMQAEGAAPSFAHGDLVPRNIHVSGSRAGLIDFANCQRLSHPLYDIFNLKVAISTMPLPARRRDHLWSAFQEGLGEADAPPATSRFFYELHRRRWLMLNLKTKNPRRWAQALRGRKSFVRALATREEAL